MTHVEVNEALRDTNGRQDRTTALYRIVVLSLILFNALLNYSDAEEECEMVPGNEDAVWEVTMRVDGSDVATAAAFERADGKLDVVMGIVDTTAKHGVADILLVASRLIRAGRFSESGNALHEIGLTGHENSAPPF